MHPELAAANWPGCPRHPHSHPLAPAEIEDRAVWRCPADGTELATIGGYRSLPERR